MSKLFIKYLDKKFFQVGSSGATIVLKPSLSRADSIRDLCCGGAAGEGSSELVGEGGGDEVAIGLAVISTSEDTSASATRLGGVSSIGRVFGRMGDAIMFIGVRLVGRSGLVLGMRALGKGLSRCPARMRWSSLVPWVLG